MNGHEVVRFQKKADISNLNAQRETSQGGLFMTLGVIELSSVVSM
jgi:hypothetical protein